MGVIKIQVAFVLITALLISSCQKMEVKDVGVGSTSGIKLFGDENGEVLKSFGKTSDGGFYFGGYTFNTPGAGAQGFIRKTDAAGQTLWYHLYGGQFDDSFLSVRPTSDGGFIACGVTTSFGNGAARKDYIMDALLTKLDANGNTVWQKTFGQQYYDKFVEVTESPDNGFVAVGRLGSSSPSAYIVKTDQNGQMLWSDVAFTNRYSQGTDVVFLPSGDIAMSVSYQFSNRSDSQNYFYPAFALVSRDGNIIKSQYYIPNWGTNSNFPTCKLLPCSDGFIMATNINQAMNTVVLSKFNVYGQLVWVSKFNGLYSAYFDNLSYNSDGSILISGTTTTSLGISKFWMLQADAGGKKINEIHEGANLYSIMGVASVRSGNHWATGVNMQATNASHKSYYGLIFTDNNGKITEQPK